MEKWKKTVTGGLIKLHWEIHFLIGAFILIEGSKVKLF